MVRSLRLFGFALLAACSLILNVVMAAPQVLAASSQRYAGGAFSTTARRAAGVACKGLSVAPYRRLPWERWTPGWTRTRTDVARLSSNF